MWRESLTPTEAAERASSPSACFRRCGACRRKVSEPSIVVGRVRGDSNEKQKSIDASSLSVATSQDFKRLFSSQSYPRIAKDYLRDLISTKSCVGDGGCGGTSSRRSDEQSKDDDVIACLSTTDASCSLALRFPFHPSSSIST